MAQTVTARKRGGGWRAVIDAVRPPPRISVFVLRRMLPIAVLALLVLDLAYAANWLFVPGAEHQSPAYDVVKTLPIEAPIAVAGALLAVWTLFTGATLFHMKSCYWGAYGLILGCAYWTAWTIVAWLSVIGPDGAGGFFPITMAGMAFAHLTLGLAWPARRTVVGPHPHVAEEVARSRARSDAGV